MARDNRKRGNDKVLEVPADSLLEAKVLALFIRVPLVRQLFNELTEEDFFDKELKKIFSLIKALWSADPSFNLMEIYDNEGLDTETLQAVLSSSIPSNKIEALEDLRNFTLFRKMIMFGHDLSKEKLVEGHVREFYHKKIAEFENLVPLSLVNIIKTNEIGKYEKNRANFGRLPFRRGGDILYEPGSLVIIGARPSVGKTTLALNLAERSRGIPCLIASLEMPANQLLDKLLSMSCINYDNRAAFDYMQFLEKIKDAESLFSAIRRSVRLYNTKLIFIDYLQLLHSQRKLDNRNLEISHITRQLKMLAMELGVTIFLLSQLSRDSQARAPYLSDLRDSGAIEQDADIVLLLHAPEKDKQKLVIIVAKNRNGEANTSFDVNFIKEKHKIEEFDEIDTSVCNR